MEKKDSEEPIVSSSAGSEESPSISAIPGSVGAVSQDVGYDVRDLMMMGFTPLEILSFSREDILEVVEGKLSLEQLRSRQNQSGDHC